MIEVLIWTAVIVGITLLISMAIRSSTDRAFRKDMAKDIRKKIPLVE